MTWNRMGNACFLLAAMCAIHNGATESFVAKFIWALIAWVLIISTLYYEAEERNQK